MLPRERGGANRTCTSRPGAGGRPPVPNAVAIASQAARLGFIRKVYCILSLQLALTFGLVSIFTFVPDVRFWVLDYQDGGGVWFPWTAMGLAFGFFVVLVCCVVSHCCPRGAPRLQASQRVSRPRLPVYILIGRCWEM